MTGQIVEITSEGRHLALTRGFLAIMHGGQELGRIPLDDIDAVIAATPALSYSNQLLAALAERGAPVVICGTNFTPTACLLPISGHHAQGERMEAQAGATQPMRKQLWAQLIKAKITAQADVLYHVGVNDIPVRALAAKVRSGDPDNLEAQAAQRYFPTLFGKGFTRDRSQGGTNSFLNYGYTVLRAGMARAIVAAGLHPSLSLHHKSRGESLRLADDLMEPFRPLVDLLVHGLVSEGHDELNPTTKRHLASVLHMDLSTIEGTTTTTVAMSRLSTSLAQCYTGERRKLAFPKTYVPLLEATSQNEDEPEEHPHGPAL